MWRLTKVTLISIELLTGCLMVVGQEIAACIVWRFDESCYTPLIIIISIKKKKKKKNSSDLTLKMSENVAKCGNDGFYRSENGAI